jgi:geranylgeranyl reductase family protein
MDVAVIGAGPAGAWAAYRLAARGARVTMFDASHPREKACGGGITGRALALVSEAFPPDAIPSRAIASARFTSADGHADVVVPLAPNSLVVASRKCFDEILLASAIRAGAELCRSRVLDVEVTPAGARVKTADGAAFTTSFIVGADGANSLVRRRLARRFGRSQLSIATGFFARGATSREIVIEVMSNPAGYLWSFPRPDHLAIGICAQADAGAGVEALRARCGSWVERTGLARGATLHAYSWPIPSLAASDFAAQTIGSHRWCLVGDAAGLVDPITREGIFFALASGAAAADAIIAARDPMADYTARVKDEIADELAHAARLKTGFFRPAFNGLLMKALNESRAVREVMADLISGTQGYRSLKWRLLQTLEFRIAWQTLRKWSAKL